MGFTGTDIRRLKEKSLWQIDNNKLSIISIGYNKYYGQLEIVIDGPLMTLMSASQDEKLILTHKDFGSFKPIEYLLQGNNLLVKVSQSESVHQIEEYIDENEIKEIEGFPDYFVNRKGEIFSTKRGGMKKLKPFIPTCSSSLITIVLRDIKSKTILNVVARLVAKAFIPNPDNLEVVTYIDGNNRNINASNLCWVKESQHSRSHYTRYNQLGCTDKNGNKIIFSNNDEVCDYLRNNYHVKSSHNSYLLQQIREAVSTNRSDLYGVTWKIYPLISQYDYHGNHLRDYMSFNELMCESNVLSTIYIRACCNGELQHVHGYQWRWYDANTDMTEKIPPILKGRVYKPFVEIEAKHVDTQPIDENPDSHHHNRYAGVITHVLDPRKWNIPNMNTSVTGVSYSKDDGELVISSELNEFNIKMNSNGSISLSLSDYGIFQISKWNIDSTNGLQIICHLDIKDLNDMVNSVNRSGVK